MTSGKKIIGAGLLLTAIAFILVGCLKESKAEYSLEDFTNGQPIVNNPDAKNVSYNELMAFLDTYIPPVTGAWSCGPVALDLHDKAEANGIKAAVVFAIVSPDASHAFNLFKTTDQGKLYIDASWGSILIAEKEDGNYRFIKREGTKITIQNLGPEKDFYIFW